MLPLTPLFFLLVTDSCYICARLGHFSSQHRPPTAPAPLLSTALPLARLRIHLRTFIYVTDPLPYSSEVHYNWWTCYPFVVVEVSDKTQSASSSATFSQRGSPVSVTPIKSGSLAAFSESACRDRISALV